ncbi:MAG TPA: hypothetical protein P5317_10750 [Myxococcota bacterium]|nr:hypothetical protein [Myxococcota bacterium]HRR74838.1 hypothetical protein [Myxococcota bacterium]HRV18472.1 hypothetical protein [Myxococcota bacterium]
MDAENQLSQQFDKVNLGRLFARIARATINLPPLERKFHPAVGGSAFYYVPADVLIPAAGKALAAEGVVVIPDITSPHLEKVERTWQADILVVFHICSVDGDVFTVTIPGNGVSFGTAAKAIKGAMTSAHCMLLSNLLHISGESDDEDGADDQQQSSRNGKTTYADKKSGATGQNDKTTSAAPKSGATGQNDKTTSAAPKSGATGQSKAGATGQDAPVVNATQDEVDALGVELFGDKWPEEYAAKLKAVYQVESLAVLSPENQQAFLNRVKQWLDKKKATPAAAPAAAK